jgi:hypothetical protein
MRRRQLKCPGQYELWGYAKWYCLKRSLPLAPVGSTGARFLQLQPLMIVAALFTQDRIDQKIRLNNQTPSP